MLKKFYLIICAALALSGCATAAKYNAELNAEIGKTSSALISKYGTPTRVKRLANGDEIYTYVNINYQVLPSPNYYFNTDFMTEDEMFAPFTYGGNEIPVGNFMGEVITDYCNTKFYLKNNVVTSWQWRGNACVAL